MPPEPEEKLLTIAIAIDVWKFPIFSQNLQQANYEFEKKEGLTPNMMILHVMVKKSDLPDLTRVIEYCQVKAAEQKN